MNYGYRVTNLGKNVWLLYLRATSFGISYSDLVQADEAAQDWTSWSEALAHFAARYEKAAQEAWEAQRVVSARQLWRRAVDYYHFAQMFLRGDKKIEYQTNCWRVYGQLAPLLKPKCQRISIPFNGVTLPGYLRVFRPGAPCVVLLGGGFEFSKEVELHKFGDFFLQRGMSVVCFDGPGQGEIAGALLLKVVDSDCAVSAVIDFLACQEGLVDTSRIGVFGVSLSGYLAARATAMDHRIMACISLSGFFDERGLCNLAPRNQQAMARMFGFDDPKLMVQPDGPLPRLDTLPCALDRPFLIIHGSEDHLVSMEQVELLQAWAKGKTDLWLYEGAEHVCHSHFGELLPAMGDWMAEHLGCGPAVGSRHLGQRSAKT